MNHTNENWIKDSKDIATSLLHRKQNSAISVEQNLQSDHDSTYNMDLSRSGCDIKVVHDRFFRYDL